MMPNTGDLIRQISDMLAQLAAGASTDSANGRTDRAKELERIVAHLFNIIHGGDFRNQNTDGPTFPAIDLGDSKLKIAVQVTIRSDREKVNDALNDFLKYDLDKIFNRLIVMMFAPKVQIRDEVDPDAKYASKNFTFRKKEDVWDLRRLNREIEDLDDEQVEEIYDYLTKQTGRTTRPKPRYLLPTLPPLAASFVEGSRDGEVAELTKIAESGEPVFIWGLGGMGKTQVAIQLGKTLQQTRDVYFIHYTPPMGDGGEAMRETILRAHFAGYKFQGPDNENRDVEFAERMDILRTEYAGTVLVIDNFDWPGKSLADLQAEKAYQELTQCGLTLVFTTRSEAPGVEIGPLAEETLLGMIRRDYRDEDVADGELLKLIRAVDGHTMMVDLLGKTLARSRGRVTAADLLEAFGGGLDRENLPEVANTHNQSAGQKRIYEHMKILFDVSVLAEGQREILRYATLLPEDGLDYPTFEKCMVKAPEKNIRRLWRKLCGKKQEKPLVKQLEELVDSGWLQCREKRLMIHPVVREVCLGELKPGDENCGNFLNRLWNLHDFDTFYDADIFLQLAQCFSVASERLDDRAGTWALRAGRYWKLVGQAQMALTYELRMLQKREQNMPDSVELATACNNVAATYGALGDHEKALEYNLKALGIWEKKLPPDHPALATSYSNAAVIYGELGDYEKQLEYHLKALGIREKKLPPDHPALALSYNNMAGTYGELGDHEKELEYNLKALGICEKKLPPDHPDLALSYNNVAVTYGELGDHEKALEYALKALGIREKKLPPDHPALAASYSNVAGTYGALGDHEKALEYDLKALGIREKKFPPDHPDLAMSYNKIGVTYAYMGEYQKALEYLEKALAIREKKLPAGHPRTEATRRNIAIVKKRLSKI